MRWGMTVRFSVAIDEELRIETVCTWNTSEVNSYTS